MGSPGNPKSGGRKKGALNRKTVLLEELCEKKGIHPFEALLKLCVHPDVSIQLGAIKEACSYLYPKRKAIEVSQDPDAPGTSLGQALIEECRTLFHTKLNERK